MLKPSIDNFLSAKGEPLIFFRFAVWNGNLLGQDYPKVWFSKIFNLLKLIIVAQN